MGLNRAAPLSQDAIVSELIARGKKLFRAAREPVRFTGDAQADAALNDIERYPHLFVLGCVMDRQMKSERCWMIPYLISERLGSKRFGAFASLRLFEIRSLMTQKKMHRFVEEMSHCLHEAIGRIAEDYSGDASQMWSDKPSSAELVWRFLEFRGVGPKLATMAANILARQFKVPLGDYYSVDISVDSHVRRVFARLGLVQPGSSVEQVVYRARALYPRFPGLLDNPVWEIGRGCCRPQRPRCGECYLSPHCPTARRAAETAAC